MPRQPRIDIPGLLQHVIFRGVEQKNIFLDNEDRENFVERLKTLLDETETRCLAWVLLNNHVHLLLLPSKQPDIVMAKTIICYVATRLLRVKETAVANRLKLSTSAVSKAAIRGQKLFAESGDLKRIIEVDISTTSP